MNYWLLVEPCGCIAAARSAEWSHSESSARRFFARLINGAWQMEVRLGAATEAARVAEPCIHHERDAIRAHQQVNLRSHGEAKRWLINYLKSQGGSALASDIYDEAVKHGFVTDNIGRVSRQLDIEKVKTGYQGAWMWCLNTEGTSR